MTVDLNVELLDTDVIVRDFLIAPYGDALSNLVGDRVYVPTLPKNPQGAPEFVNAEPAIWFFVSSGSGKETIVADDVVYEFRCFGGKTTDGAWMAGDAKAVYNALRARFRNVSNLEMPTGVISRVKNVMTGQDLTEPDSDWPFVLSRFQILCKSHGH